MERKEIVVRSKYIHNGRLRSSRMNDNVLEKGLRKGMVEMRDEMRGLLWKIERSRDIHITGRNQECSPEGI